MTIWTPDTCDCRIEYNGNINWVQTYFKCRLHERIKGQNLLDTVLAQNRRFNTQFPNLTDSQRKIVRQAKVENKLRIQREDLSNFTERLPSQSFIRRVFRI